MSELLPFIPIAHVDVDEGDRYDHSDRPYHAGAQAQAPRNQDHPLLERFAVDGRAVPCGVPTRKDE